MDDDGHSKSNLNSKIISCNVCKKPLKTKSNLVVHKRIYSREKRYKSFIQKDHLTAHMLVHSGKKEGQCYVCGKYFSQKGYLKSFTQNSNMKKHMLVHNGKKNFQCKVCDKTFSEKGNMKRHMLMILK